MSLVYVLNSPKGRSVQYVPNWADFGGVHPLHSLLNIYVGSSGNNVQKLILYMKRSEKLHISYTVNFKDYTSN